MNTHFGEAKKSFLQNPPTKNADNTKSNTQRAYRYLEYNEKAFHLNECEDILN